MSVRLSSSPLDSVAIVGVGLIGGSIAAAIKLRRVARTVIGVGRSRERLEAAREAGIIDRVATDVGEIGAAGLVIVCTPVDRIVEDVRRLAALGAGTLITDAGSVKSCIVDELRGSLSDGVTFVGSHPMAGSEKTGWENGQADLFIDRLCVITPDEESPEEAVSQVEQFWQAIGMRTQRMSAAEHDRAVAATSHVPHLTAAALISLVNNSNAALASTGFRDVTRIAAGDPSLWVAILQGNKSAVTAEVDHLIGQLADYRQALADDNFDTILSLLAEAKNRRDSLDL